MNAKEFKEKWVKKLADITSKWKWCNEHDFSAESNVLFHQKELLEELIKDMEWVTE